MQRLKSLFRGADADRRRAESVLQFYQVLEDEFESIHGEKPKRLPLIFLPDQIRDFDELKRLLQLTEKPEPLRWVSERMDLTRAALERFALAGAEAEAQRSGEETQLRIAVVADLNRLLEGVGGERLADAAEVRRGAERSLTRSLVEEYPERAGAVDPVLLGRLLLEDIFPRALWRIDDLRLAAIYREIHGKHQSALCLSGGGIRSATFALGVVQGLARHGLLDKFHYLSTVSGGGYLGGWLSAWMTHSTPAEVVAELDPESSSRMDPPPIDPQRGPPADRPLGPSGGAPAPEPRPLQKAEPAPVRHLRSYSNYLSPRMGVFSADTWTLVATVLRNLFLNWLVIVPLLTAAVLVPFLAVAVLDWVPSQPAGWLAAVLVGAFAVLGLAFGAAAVAYIHEDPTAEPPSPPEARVPAGAAPAAGGAREFLTHCFAPLLASAVLLTTAWWWLTNPEWGFRPEPSQMLLYLVLFGAALHLGGWSTAQLRVAFRDRARPRLRRTAAEAAVIAVTGAIGGGLGFYAASLIQAGAKLVERPVHAYAVLALPLFLTVLLFGGQLYVGLASRWTPSDESREWAARFGAWLLIAATGWLVLSALVLEGQRLVGASIAYLAGAGVLSGAAAALVGRSAKTPGGPDAAEASGGSPLRGVLLPALAILTMAILVVVLARLGTAIVGLAGGGLPSGWNVPEPFVVFATGAVLLLAGLGMGRLINTNMFSLHAMYRMRLIRAYLGASLPAGVRRPDPFTGFDERDNLPMHRLRPDRTRSPDRRAPLHLVNATLNLVGDHKLAWQERKSDSFTISALHAGAASLGYRRTSLPPDKSGNLPDCRPSPDRPRLYGGTEGITLGTAMTISGAAANPNMGYYSSPMVTFLMTLFNARLGWWLGNPGPAGQETFGHAGPRVGVSPILTEMFGMTTDRSDYVQLSDGGHFENLGLYEMVRRRCKFIVVSDASCDPACNLDDLGGAIRKIRVDMGIPIDFVDGFRIFGRSAAERSGDYWALGRIRYSARDRAFCPDRDAAELDGTLIYIKPAFYGSEPRDIYNYGLANPDFPHQSTVDQFFNESQFESYRALGMHAIDSALRELDGSAPFETPMHPPQPGSLPWFEFRIRQREAAGMDTAAS
jgi:hypothetical protein